MKKNILRAYTKSRLKSEILFLMPGALGLAVFFIAPFCLSLYYAFMSKPKGGTFVGLSHYIALFQNSSYKNGLFNTVRFIAISVPLTMCLSLISAIMIRKIKTHKTQKLISLFFLMPLVIPSGSTVFFWKSLFAYDGTLNGILNKIGLETINFLDTNWALAVMALIFIWKNIGYTMVLYRAGLSNIPKDFYEAASVDGAGSCRTFVYITLPSLMSTSVLASLMTIINSFKVFREIYLITGTYPHQSIYTLQHFMNNQFSSFNYPRLTSATTVLVVIITLFTQTLLKLERKVT